MSRAWSPAPAAAALVAAGCVVGIAVALSQSPLYRATTTVVVTVHGVPAVPTAKDAVPTIAALAAGDVVVENVAAGMHLGAGSVRSHLRATVVGRTALIRLSYDDAQDVRARQLAQESASALLAVVSARFGSRLSVAVVDTLHSSRLGRPWFDDALIGALAGALLGVAWQSRRLIRRPAVGARRKRVVAAAAPGTQRSPPPPPVVAPVAAPVAMPAQVGRIAELRQELAERRGEFDLDQVVTWEAYLDALELQAVDGELPPSFDGLMRDVFEPLTGRRR